MPQESFQNKARTAVKKLKRADSVMKEVIQRVGPCRLRPDRDRFGMLARSIISQQISTSAARSIRSRLIELLEPEGITPNRLLMTSAEDLRTAGVSPQKASYLHDLADAVESGRVVLNQIGRLSDERIIDQLTKIKGIGHWTAQMFLIFSLGRFDVMPYGDLGVRSAIRNLYELKELPDKAICLKIAENWRPYASIASWYCWRSLELND